MKVLIAEFRQETNSLSPTISTIDFWRSAGWVLAPDEVDATLRGTGTALAGMIDEVERQRADAQIVFGPSMYAQSGGTAADAVLEEFWSGLRPTLHENGAPDVVLFSFHGALQTESHDDAEAEILRRVRAELGSSVVIGVSTDLHGFVSRDFAREADVLCGYQTYPHIDFVETGARAARFALRTVEGTVPLHRAWVPIPMIVSASAYNSLEGPFAALMERARGMVAGGRIVDFTIYQMQPWLDVAAPNSTVIVLADDAQTARLAAEELATALYAERRAFASRLHSIDEVIDIASDPSTAKPVILVDSADSNNAGAPGDSMAVAERLLTRERMPRSATVVGDASAAERAHELGVGAEATFRIGGAVDPSAPAIEAVGVVRSLHDGVFRPEGVGSAGDLVRIGRSAVIRFGDDARGTLDVLVCEQIAGNGDPQLYRAFGIEPTMHDLIVIKANTSFRAGYTSIAGTICETDTPGAASARVESLPFRRLPRTIYPWIDDPFVPQAEVWSHAR
ncbi:M81 family metallopeptidase [Microbacterium keratanolyticum]|uniref:M81 family metallopeptidase n=1 Tax=Microbacterium keratanolyticum TaxID=67574 RepID=UPI0036335352